MSSRQEAIEQELITLLNDSQDIEMQLSNRNRVDSDGNRLFGFAYWEWRYKAVYALNCKRRQYRELKLELKQLKAVERMEPADAR